MKITQKRLKQLVKYNPRTGIFQSRIKDRERWPGKPLGFSNGKSGHIRFMLQRRLYLAHRLAWLYVYGKWPNGDLDHKNRNGADNRITNLREATPSQNQINGPGRNSATGFKGVTFHKKAKTVVYQARVGKIYCGLFDTPQKAHAAYKKKAKELYGEFV